MSPKKMFVTSKGIIDGVIQDKYGIHGTQFYREMPTCSLPLEIHNPPEGYKSFAIVIEDKEAIPLIRFSWIHWIAANITWTYIEENVSVKDRLKFVQGVNSRASKFLGREALTDIEASRYGGMGPPDKPHTYEIHFFALDKMLDLKNGFYLNELYDAMEGHILGYFLLKGIYRK